ncbi:MAG: ribonuclease P protein component [Myxococcota bacterium]
MASVAGRFGRSERLRRSREFQRVSREGQRAATQHFVLLRAPAAGRPPGLRLGVTVSRAVGNSVARNRVKRVIREWFRIVGKNLEGLGDSDLVIIARRGAATVAGGAMLVELDALARRAGEAAD